MGRVVFLVEERSMLVTLQNLLPKLFPAWQEEVNWLAVAFKGKSDLEKGIERKLRAWREPGVRFVILRDNDNSDCKALKSRLLKKTASREPEEVLVRIVCQELEAWFLGDPAALSAAYPTARLTSHFPAKYRDPDTVANASEEVTKLTATQAKIDRAGRIAVHLQPQRNTSRSFQVFVAGLDKMVNNQP